MADVTYAQDMALLQDCAEVIELSGPSGDRVAVVPAFQGRVMTSTAAGARGASFGWINEPFLAARRHDDPVFNNYGGEDRFWLGPEAGQFGLWFEADAPMDLAHVRTPAGFGAGAWPVTGRGERSVAMTRQFYVTNRAGTRFDCAVERVIQLLDRDAVAEHLGATVPSGVEVVAFESVNILANAGRAAWTPRSGLVSIWILGMFKAAPDGWAVLPYLSGDERTLGPRACTNYFGEVPPERARLLDDHILFKVDGRHRSKVGISPVRAANVLGSFDPAAEALTIVQFNLPAGAAKLPYVNSQWMIQDDPLAGDAVNAYNDGGTRDGQATFYELESSSPAAALKGDDSITHTHRTCHFIGRRDGLRELATKVLGVELDRLG